MSNIQQAVFDKIEKAEEKNLTELNLSHHLLTELPKEIIELKNLTKLNLSGNQLTKLPKEIIELNNLTKLDLSGNKLTSLSQEIGRLTNLSELWLSDNELISLPKEIGELKSLRELRSNKNSLECLPKEIGELKNLTKLDLSHTLLTGLPKEIGELNNLAELNLMYSRLNSLPKEIGELKNLKRLNLCRNQVINFTGSSEGLKLPKEIGGLKNLSELYLEYNLVTILPKEIGELINLTELDLSRNQLTSLPQEIGGLKNLKKLYLSSNQLTSLPREIGKLNNLRELYLSRNQFTSLPQEIGELNNLKKLYLSANQLTSLPREIGKLKNLSELYLGSNQLTRLPQEIVELENLTELDSGNNPLTEPPQEIVNKGIESIRAWFGSENKVEFYYAKLIFIGNTEVGKTTIRENLLDPGYGIKQHESTVGLNIKKYDKIKINSKSFIFNIWDMGGQGRYRAVQQLFCSPNSLYLFVTSPTDEMNIKFNDNYVGFEYWLSFISSYGYEKEYGHSSVIYVLNKIDTIPSDYHGILQNIKMEIESTGFTNIKEYIGITCTKAECSSKNKSDLTELISCIEKHIPHSALTKRYSADWIKVIGELDKLRKAETSIISRREYLEIFKACNPDSNSSKKINIAADTWLHVLNFVGEVMYFPNIKTLKETVILNPEWIKNAACSILDYQPAKNNNGRFTYNDLYSIWSKYQPDDYPKLLELITKGLDLCYEVRTSNEEYYLVPILFANRRPQDLEYFNNEKELFMYEITYGPFIPAGILSRLITRMNYNIYKKNLYWKNGVVFSLTDSTDTLAEVTETWQERKITVKIKGEETFSLFSKIRDELLIIKNEIKNSTNLTRLEIKESYKYKDKVCDVREHLRILPEQEIPTVKISNIIKIENNYAPITENNYGNKH